MALILMDGYDDYNSIPERWDNYFYEPLGSLITPGVFSYGSCRSNNNAKYVAPGLTSIVVSFHFRPKEGTLDVSGTNSPWIAFENAGENVKKAGVFIQNTGIIVLRAGYTSGGEALPIIASSTQQLAPGFWYWISCKYTCSHTAGLLSVYVNDSLWVSATGDIAGSPGSADAFDTMYWRKPSSWTGDNLFDNLHINDLTGAAPFNDVLTERRVYFAMPSAAGAKNQWTPTGSASNWENVNNLNPANPPAAYNSSSTPGQEDIFNFADIAPTGTPSIDAVQVNLYSNKDDAGARRVTPIVRDAGGTEYVNASPQDVNSAWFTYRWLYLVDPATAVQWTLANLNAYQYGYQLDT